MSMVDCTFMGEHQRKANATAHEILGRIEEMYDLAFHAAGGDTRPVQTTLPILSEASVKLMSLVQQLEFQRLRYAHS